MSANVPGMGIGPVPESVPPQQSWPAWLIIIARALNQLLLGNGIYAYAHPTPEMWGAVGDGTTDDTAAIQAAINATAASRINSTLYFGPKTYLVSGELTIASSMRLVGCGPNTTTIKTNSATANILTVTAVGVVIQDFGFTNAVTRTAGYYVDFQSAATQSRLSNFYMAGFYIGIHMGSTSNNRADHGYTFGGSTTAGSAVVLIDAGNDHYLEDITSDNANGSQTSYGIRIVNSGCTNITNCDIIHSGNCLSLAPGNGQSVASTYVVNSYFDTSNADGISFAASGTGTIIRSLFNNVWASSHTGNGVNIQSGGTVAGVVFNACHGLLNTSSGILINGGNSVIVNASQFAANTSHGIAVGANVTKFTVTANQIGTVAGLATNGGWGVLISAGTSDNYVVAHNMMFGNTAGNFSDGGTGVNKIVAPNVLN